MSLGWKGAMSYDQIIDAIEALASGDSSAKSGNA